jgi:type I restriction enzyme, S subunit
MKDADDQLARLPESWEWSKIGDFANVMGGKRLPKDHEYSEVPTDHAYIRVTDFDKMTVDTNDLRFILPETHEIIKKYVILKSDLYISIAGSIGKIGIIPDSLDGSNLTENAAKITNLKNVDARFLCYFLNSNFAQNQIKDLIISTNQPKLALFRIEKIITPIAPFPEQRRIVARIEELFSHLDAGVIALQRAKIQLRRYRQAVLKAAVEGRLTEEWRRAHPKVEPAETPPEQVEGLPRDWCLVILKNICVDITDGDHQAPPQSSAGIPFLVISNIKEGKLDFAKTRFVPEEYYDLIPRIRKPTLEDILYSLVGSYGIPVIVNTERKFCFQRHIGLIRPSRVVDTKYLFYFLKSNFAFSQATDAATGTAQLTVSLQGLRSFKVPFPPLTEQKMIVSEIERRFSASDSIESMLQISQERANHLRQSILKRAFEGRLVPQDPGDEPASVLLERIKDERAKAAPKSGRKNNSSAKQMRLIQ